MDLISNDWKHLLKTETSQKILFKNFVLQHLSYWKAKASKIYFILLYDSSKYNKPFKFILLLNFFEGHLILIPKIWDKTLTD